jgi:hypothetical protein
VATVTGLGWAGTKNGALLHLAAKHGVEALITVDVVLQVATDAPMRVLVLRAGSNLQARMSLNSSVFGRLAALPPGRTVPAPRRSTFRSLAVPDP